MRCQLLTQLISTVLMYCCCYFRQVHGSGDELSEMSTPGTISTVLMCCCYFRQVHGSGDELDEISAPDTIN